MEGEVDEEDSLDDGDEDSLNFEDEDPDAIELVESIQCYAETEKDHNWENLFCVADARNK